MNTFSLYTRVSDGRGSRLRSVHMCVFRCVPHLTLMDTCACARMKLLFLLHEKPHLEALKYSEQVQGVKEWK